MMPEIKKLHPYVMYMCCCCVLDLGENRPTGAPGKELICHMSGSEDPNRWKSYLALPKALSITSGSPFCTPCSFPSLPDDQETAVLFFLFRRCGFAEAIKTASTATACIIHNLLLRSHGPPFLRNRGCFPRDRDGLITRPTLPLHLLPFLPAAVKSCTATRTL